MCKKCKLVLKSKIHPFEIDLKQWRYDDGTNDQLIILNTRVHKCVGGCSAEELYHICGNGYVGSFCSNCVISLFRKTDKIVSHINPHMCAVCRVFCIGKEHVKTAGHIAKNDNLCYYCRKMFIRIDNNWCCNTCSSRYVSINSNCKLCERGLLASELEYCSKCQYKILYLKY